MHRDAQSPPEPDASRPTVDPGLPELVDELRADAAGLRRHYEALAAALEELPGIGASGTPAPSALGRSNGQRGPVRIWRAGRRNVFRRHLA